MAYRTFVDRDGNAWQVWEVRPTTVERRLTERRRSVAPFEGLDRRVGGERRTRSEQRVSLGPELAGGWLAFHSEDEKRRYSPVPEGWETKNPLELSELLQQARRMPRAERGSLSHAEEGPRC